MSKRGKKIGLVDTLPEADEVQIECYRQMTIARRLAIVRSLTRAGFNQSYRAISDANPGITETEKKLMMIELNYGAELAEEVRKRLAV